MRWYLALAVARALVVSHPYRPTSVRAVVSAAVPSGLTESKSNAESVDLKKALQGHAVQLSVCIARYFITLRGRPRALRSLLQWKDLPPGRLHQAPAPLGESRAGASTPTASFTSFLAYRDLF